MHEFICFNWLERKVCVTVKSLPRREKFMHVWSINIKVSICDKKLLRFENILYAGIRNYSSK